MNYGASNGIWRAPVNPIPGVMMAERVYISEERPQYAAVPYPIIEAMHAGTISHSAVCFYVALDYYRNRKTQSCWPGYRALARDLHLSVGTVHALTAKCVEAGFIRLDKPDNKRLPTVFVLLYSPVQKTERSSPFVFSSCSTGLYLGKKNIQPVDSRVQLPISNLNHSSENHENQLRSGSEAETALVVPPAPSVDEKARKSANRMLRECEQIIREKTGAANAVNFGAGIKLIAPLIKIHSEQLVDSVMNDHIWWCMGNGKTWTVQAFVAQFEKKLQHRAIRAKEIEHARDKASFGNDQDRR